MKHLSDLELRALLDDEASERHDAPHHLRDCPRCSNRLKEMASLDKLVRRSVREHAPINFTANVLQRLRIEEKPSRAWRALQYLAPVVALAIIAGIVFAVFHYTGAVQQPEVQSTIAYGSGAANKVMSSASSWVESGNTWAKSYLHFAFAGKALPFSAFLFFFFVAIAIIDRYFLAPMLRKGKEAI